MFQFSGRNAGSRVAFAVILAVYMLLTMLYTCVLFPNFGA